MPKILSCWFWKPKTKSFSKTENKSNHYSYVVTSEPIVIEGESKFRHSVGSQIVLPLYLKKAESFNQNNSYFKGFSGLTSQTIKVKSVPASPRKLSLNDKRYFSDQNLQTMSNYNLHSKYSNLVLSASSPENSSNHKPRATLGSNEPFPFQVPKDTAPRQSLFYEMRYGDTDNSETNPNSMCEAEKPMEDYNNLNSYGKTPKPQQSLYKHQLHNQHNLESQNDKSKTRNPILHVRPVSVENPLKLHADGSVTAPNKSIVHQLKLKPENKTPLLMTNEGKVLHPLQTDKVRTSLLRKSNEISPVRISVVQPVKPIYFEETVPTIPLRRSFRRSSLRQSPVLLRDVEVENLNRSSLLSERETSTPILEDGEDLDSFSEIPARKSIRRSSVRLARMSKENEYNSFPYTQTENEPVVYAVPVVPTRGRSKSLLQQSAKSLASRSQKEEPVIYRKNIRYSMDTDVFSAETRRRSVSPASPGFINMERGQPMLVSEVLNPITSLFISDLKNPVPKDPIRKPKEANIWVKPRRYSAQRSSFSKQSSKPVARIQTTAPAPITRTVAVQRRPNRKSQYKYQEESSSSDESIVVYRKKSKQSAPRRSYQQAVYAAQMPNSVLPQPDHNYNRSSLHFPRKSEHELSMAQTSSGNDVCGLTLGSDQRLFENLQSPYYVKMISSAQQTDIEDELDLICYPSESVLKKSVVPSESGSKLRWRIIIKRGEEK